MASVRSVSAQLALNVRQPNLQHCQRALHHAISPCSLQSCLCCSPAKPAWLPGHFIGLAERIRLKINMRDTNSISPRRWRCLLRGHLAAAALPPGRLHHLCRRLLLPLQSRRRRWPPPRGPSAAGASAEHMGREGCLFLLRTTSAESSLQSAAQLTLHAVAVPTLLRYRHESACRLLWRAMIWAHLGLLPGGTDEQRVANP